VLPLRATAIAAAAGDGQQTGIRGAVSQPPSVLATDVFGNPVPGVGVVFVVVTGGGAVEGDHQITSGDGIAAVGNWTLGSTPGANTLHATSEGLTGSPVVFNATATPIATAVTIQVRDNIFVSERNGSGGRSSFFSGAVDTIAAGGTVTWVWVGQNHNVTPSQSNDPSLSGNQNAPFTLGPITFSSAGVYEYRCTNHSHAVDGEIVGMKGRIVIR
jgi:plastocyanin